MIPGIIAKQMDGNILIDNWISIMGPGYWQVTSASDPLWNGLEYVSIPATGVGDGITSLVNIQADKIRITYTCNGYSSPALNGITSGSDTFFTPNNTGSWISEADLPVTGFSVNDYLMMDSGDTGLVSFVITNIELKLI